MSGMTLTLICQCASECHGEVRSKKLGLDYKLFVGKCISAISDPLNTDMFRQMHRRTCPKKVHILFITLQLFTNTLVKTSYVDEKCPINLICYFSPFISCLSYLSSYLSLFIYYLTHFIGYLTDFISCLSLFISYLTLFSC